MTALVKKKVILTAFSSIIAMLLWLSNISPALASSKHALAASTPKRHHRSLPSLLIKGMRITGVIPEQGILSIVVTHRSIISTIREA
ncbi:hypothetical protein KSX_28420 [Ktedonospora formicarum]|uniref:Uncharacterized protein n=1 Tax=Ktedonospora formicarum TaxID=2778364 RepID=A0A8J3I4I8_9CHLR|nr:hypothetical protein KSX_28420 [Ktedonospora formicarum]